MASSKQRRRTKKRVGGAHHPPGSYHLDLEPGGDSVLRLMSYDASGLDERVITDLGELRTLQKPGRVVWLDVSGRSLEVITAVAEAFQLHPLAVEDAIHYHQRAKLDPYPTHDCLIAKMVQAGDPLLRVEQVSFFLGDGVVITMQEVPEDPFEPVRERVRQGRGRIRTSSADYLVYALLDAIVDHYFPLLEHLGDRIEDLEDIIVAGADDGHVSEIHSIRRALVTFRRAVWPLREAMMTLSRGEESRFHADTLVFLRDTQDHVLRVLDLIESYREMSSSLMDLHLSVASQRMNETMQVLTVIATIFIPLTFIAGIYGMNFDSSISDANMPELRWEYGYPIMMALMGVIAVLLLWFFYRRGWIGSHKMRAGQRTQRASDLRDRTP